jgi:orotate phosphoribosyltransferase
MFRSSKEWEAQYGKRRSFWAHSGKPLDPHVALRSGRHSDIFFNSRPVIDDEALLDEAAHDLVSLMKLANIQIRTIDRVVGPQTGATKMSKALAAALCNHVGAPVGWASPAKHQDGDVLSMVFPEEDPQNTVYPCQDVFLCEDVLTTGGSVERTRAAVVAKKGNVLPYVAVLVNRSSLAVVNGLKVIALIDKKANDWAPGDCPLCKGGSVPIENPKDNWDKLVHAA